MLDLYEMLLCPERKIGVFYVNKVGSTTLYELFKTYTGIGTKVPGYNIHDHLNINFLPKEYKNFKFYAFYRNPIDRFLSNVDETLKQKCVSQKMSLEEFIHKTKDIILELKNKNLNDVIRTKPNMYIEDPLRRGLKLSISCGGYFPQTFWFNHNDVDLTMLNFSNFEIETKNLFSLFNINLSITDIPRKNVSKTKRNLTESDTQFVRELYSEDYDFFESKGITFI
jgi:hypothetical protein